MQFLSETLITKKIIENSKFLFLFLPLLFLPIGFEYFEFPKYLSVLAFSFFCFVSLSFKDLRPYSVILFSFLLFIILNFISSSQIFFKESFFGMDFMRQNSVFLLIALFIILIFFSQKKFPQNYLNTVEMYLLVGIFISAVIGIFQFLVQPFGLISNDWFFDGRIVSTLGHPNFLAGMTVIGLIIARKINLPWVYLILILALILSFSKTSVLLFFMYIFYEYIKKLYSQNRKLAVTIIILSFLLLIFVGTGLFSNTYKEIVGNKPYMYQFQRFMTFLDPKELSLDLRFKIWDEALKAISDSPYLGFGKGQIIRVIELPEFNDLSLSSTHNLYLDVALESGLLGLTVFLIFIISSLINSYKYDKNLFLIQLFISIHGLFDITPVIFWFLFIFISGISINKYNKNYLKQL